MPDLKRMCRDRYIKHDKVSIESHRSNGRVEQNIGTIREGLMKDTNDTLEERVRRITEPYNNTYHSGIKCTPNEVWLDGIGHVMLQNSLEIKYTGKFKKRYSESFEIGVQVRVSKVENLVNKPKEYKGRFTEVGISLISLRVIRI